MKNVFLILIIVFSVSFTKTNHTKNTIYIYHDAGASAELVSHTINMFRSQLPFFYTVREIDAEGVIQNNWKDDAIVFVMPGGADLPYVQKLNGKGNLNIKNFVENGGAYLGLCAGAYFASNYVEFDKNGALEVIGFRELNFFPGKTIGPILAPYSYINNSGARAAQIQLTLENVNTAALYYNGGGFFENAEMYQNISVIGYYQMNSKKLPAIIHINQKLGHVVLSGVHFEFDASVYHTMDPYLIKILPNLRAEDENRIFLIKAVLTILGL